MHIICFFNFQIDKDMVCLEFYIGGLYNLANSWIFVFYNYYIIIYVTKKTINIYYCVFWIHLISIYFFILREKKSVLQVIFLVLKNSIVSIWFVIFYHCSNLIFTTISLFFFLKKLTLLLNCLTCHTIKLLVCIY